MYFLHELSNDEYEEFMEELNQPWPIELPGSFPWDEDNA